MIVPSVHEMLVALYDVLTQPVGSGDIDWLLLCAIGAETIGTTDGLSIEEKRLYNAVRELAIESEWRLPE